MSSKEKMTVKKTGGKKSGDWWKEADIFDPSDFLAGASSNRVNRLMDEKKNK